jgi:hypothetical protein
MVVPYIREEGPPSEGEQVARHFKGLQSRVQQMRSGASKTRMMEERRGKVVCRVQEEMIENASWRRLNCPHLEAAADVH